MNDQKTQVLMIDSLIGNDYTLCLGLELAKNGSELEFVVPENREFDSDVPFKVIRWSPAKDNSYGKTTKTFKYLSYLFRLFKYSVSNKHKIVHFQFFRRRSDSVVFFLMSLMGVKLVYTAHNILPHERSVVDKYIQLLVYKAANAVIVHSMFIKKKLLNNFKVEEKKVHVVPHGNFDIYLPEIKMSKAEARKRLNLEMEDKVLLFFGFMREYKGLDILLDAFEIAKECDSQLKMVIAGYPVTEQNQARYSKRAREISTDRIITYFGFIPSEDVQIYLEACDVVVLPYKRIDHSGIIHLAYSFCKPVIASPVGDFPESVEEGKSGYVLPKNDAETLSQIILEAVKDKNKLNAMGAYAKRLNDTKYSWSDIAKKTQQIYKSV